MRKSVFNFLLFYVLPIPVLLASLFVGASEHASFVDYSTLFWKFIQGTLSTEELLRWEADTNIILNIRLPRVLLTFLIGAALSTSGVVLQGVLRNPLVDSYLLGISSAAAFGASLAMVTEFLPIALSAFIFGFISVAVTYFIAANKGTYSIVSIVLSGMVVSGIFTALLSVVQYISNPFKISAIVQWTLGKLNSATWEEIKQVFFPILISLIVIYIFRWRLNLISLGDEAAKAVGVNPALEKIVLVSAATLMTASSVASAGIISMYGLFLPHIIRMLSGANHVRLIPQSMLLGGTFLVLIDDFSRSLFAFEIPVGVFTMLIGGAYFVYLMKTNKLNWQ